VPETDLPAPVVEAVGKAQNALVSVEGILAALLDISRLESGKAAVTVAPIRMGRLLVQLADEFQPLAAAKGLGLTVRPCEAVVLSDPGYLRRILQNLIGNAIRYTETGRVLVAARARGGMLRLEVWDTGPGIAEAEQENIFKEFHRIAGRASASEGLGLGLAIVDRAAALLGHPLGLSSRLGRGTCCRCFWPMTWHPRRGQPLRRCRGGRWKGGSCFWWRTMRNCAVPWCCSWKNGAWR
jgi:signal transduction histidine kinase